MNFPTKHPAEPTINAIIAWYLALRDPSVSLRSPARLRPPLASGEGYGGVTKGEQPEANGV